MPEFLVAYDYGMGGLWAVAVATSADEITARYPEVVNFAEPPDWMDDERIAKLRLESRQLGPRDDAIE